MAVQGLFYMHAEVRGRELGKCVDCRRKKNRSSCNEGREIEGCGDFFSPFSATGSLLDVEKSNKVNAPCVVLEGAFLILHVLDLTAAPSSHKGK